MEHLTLEVKFASGEAGIVSGYAALFGGPADLVRDIIAPGAFGRDLAAHAALETLPAMLFEHKGAPIGTWLEIAEDELGLKVKGQIDLSTPAGREAYELVRSGAVDGLSIGYLAIKSERTPDGIRTLQHIELHEISLVRRPASSRARVLSVKSAAGAASNGKTPMENNTNTADAPTIDTRVAGLEESVAGIDTRLKAVEDKVGSVKSVTERIEAKLNRPGISTKSEEGALETKAFTSYVRRGDAATGLEMKNLTQASNGGGYLAPTEFIKEIVKGLVRVSPIRSYARVLSISAAEAKMPKRTGTLTAAWVSETGARPSTEPTYGEVTLTPHEAACYVDVSNALLEDNAYNLIGELSADFAEEFGRLEGAAFVSGDGTGKPAGILADTTIPQITSAATALTADDLIDLFHALPGFYAANGVWGANRTTIGAVRKLKTTVGDYLWRDAMAEGNPPTILGRPVVELPDMPDVAADALPILFGDLKQGYRIVDRLSLSVLRDPYSVATNGQTRFHARRRVGGGVVKAEALRLLKVKAA